MPNGRRKWTVDRSVADPQVPRFFRVAILATDKVFGPVRVIIRRVTLCQDRLATVRLNQLIVEIVAGVFRIARSVPDLLVIPVAVGSCVDAGVPLADLAGGVAVLSKHARPERTLLRVVRRAGILALHPHRVHAELMMPGEQRRAARHAPGSDERVSEPDSAFCQAVDVRRRDPVKRLGITTDAAMRVVVGVDQQNVRSLWLFDLLRFRSPHRASRENSKHDNKTNQHPQASHDKPQG